jgi:hypothetical protein
MYATGLDDCYCPDGFTPATPYNLPSEKDFITAQIKEDEHGKPYIHFSTYEGVQIDFMDPNASIGRFSVIYRLTAEMLRGASLSATHK